MITISRDVNDILKSMRNAGKLRDIKNKGNLGEDAVLSLCLEYKRGCNGILIQSFQYPYASNREGKNYIGNIKYENGKYYEVTDRNGLEDEIDILLITPYRIFPIEVKSYKANIQIYDHWMRRDNNGATGGGNKMQEVDKSPVAQAEKHARHLYHQLSPVLPDGAASYIVPIVCFVDKCAVDDDRAPANQEYLPVTILNTLPSTLGKYNVPLRYGLDLDAVRRRLKEIKISTRKEFGL